MLSLYRNERFSKKTVIMILMLMLEVGDDDDEVIYLEKSIAKMKPSKANDVPAIFVASP